ncbi:MAG: cation diffusion facilitator family transporter [Cyanobacteria bacterium J06623_4]
MKGSGYQRQSSYRLLLLTLWTTLVVFAIELTAGWVSHSLSLLADSLHMLVNAFSTLLSLVAVASPQRTLGKEIWGHGRGEVAGTLVLSAIMGFSSISILLIAFDQVAILLHGEQMPLPVSVTLPLVILVSAAVTLMMIVVLLSAQHSQQNRSLALKLNARHILSSSWLTGMLLIGLISVRQGYQWVDPVMACGLVILTVSSLWQVLHKQLPMLLQPTAIAPEAIAQIASQVEGVTRCTRILSRGMVGRQVWIEIHIDLHPEYMVIARRIGEQVERSLRDQYGPVRAQIWLDPTAQTASKKL